MYLPAELPAAQLSAPQTGWTQVNNAGLALGKSPVQENDQMDVLRMINTNVHSLCLLPMTRACQFAHWSRMALLQPASHHPRTAS